MPVYDNVIPETSRSAPAIEIACVPAIVPVKPVKIKLLQVNVFVSVTVTAPLAASIYTSSDEVGIGCPPAPPDVKAHLVPAVAFADAVPPTQYKSMLVVYASFPVAIQSQTDATSFHSKTTYRYFEITVVVGNVPIRVANDAPQVIALAVPSSFILIRNICPVVGVPERFVVNEVIAAANAVIVNISTLSVLIVGVALLVVVPILFVILLFVKVCVAASVATSSHPVLNALDVFKYARPNEPVFTSAKLLRGAVIADSGVAVETKKNEVESTLLNLIRESVTAFE